MTARRWVLATLAAVALLLVVGRMVAGVYADYAWYGAMGAEPLWSARMVTLLAWRGASWVAASLYAFVHLYAVRQSVASLVLQRRLGNIEIGETVPGRFLTLAAAALAVLLGAILTLAETEWLSAVAALRGEAFGERDPYFSADLGFFVHWLPFEFTLWAWAILVVVAVTGMVILLYVLTDGVRWRAGRFLTSAHARRHLTVVAGIGLLLLAWYFRLSMYAMLIDAPGTAATFDALDHRVGIPGRLLLSIVALGSGLLVIWTGVSGQYRLALIGIAGVGILWLATTQVVPVIVAQGADERDPAVRDRPLLATQAGFTRRAFGVDGVVESDSAAAPASLAEAAPYRSLWDEPAVRAVVGAGRDTTNLWIGWRAAPDGLRIVTVERDDPASDQSAATWSYTELDATRAGADGAPVELRRGRFPRAPIVYPGATGYAIVRDSAGAMSGVALGSAGRRIAHAWSLQNPTLVRRPDAAHQTLVDHRDLRRRIERLTPFFIQGGETSPAIVGDTLFWMIELFGATQWYPLGAGVRVGGDEWTYLRHAAVAVVNGMTGAVTVIPNATLDPLAQSWVHRFGAVFGSWSDVPRILAAARPPSVDGAVAQAIAYGRYGSRGNSDVPRHLPADDGADSLLVTRAAIHALPGGRGLAVAMPLVDETSHLRGMLEVASGSDTRPTWRPAPPATPRWPEILRRMRLADSSAAEGRAVVRGAMRAVPLRGGIVFAQPTYDWPHRSPPMLRGVAVLQDSLHRVASLHSADSTGSPTASGDLRSRVDALYGAMREALQHGDWVAFGRAFDALGRLVGRPRP